MTTQQEKKEMSTAIPKEEWMRRYRQRFVDCINPDDPDLTPGAVERIADDCAKALSFEEASDGFEDDPERAADEEMSYWSE